ncbi:partial Teichoic acids export ATP-binding protein TagH, partial [Anaerolineae bacterium]
MSSPVITFDNVSKRFSRGYYADSLRDAVAQRMRRIFSGRGHDKAQDANAFWALRGVSFEVQPGEVLGIIGPNGSGKSTTLKLLSRILRPDEGQIRVAGRLGALIELGAGFSPDLTGKENVYLNGSILGMTREEIQAKYDSIVDFAELHDFMDTPVKWYSSGMYARLGFSVAVHTDPEVLLVDEVLSVGDVGFQKKCFDKMMDIRNRASVTTVFVSHNMNAVATLCDRILLLDKGKVKAIGDPSSMVQRYLKITEHEKADQAAAVVELEKISVTSETGDEGIIFPSGARVRVSVKIRFKKLVEDVLATLMVKAGDGTMIFGTNSRRLGANPITAHEGQVVSFDIGITLNLAPGT